MRDARTRSTRRAAIAPLRRSIVRYSATHSLNTAIRRWRRCKAATCCSAAHTAPRSAQPPRAPPSARARPVPPTTRTAEARASRED
eukprot:scaffold8813_cov96-Isochrysis_galbana.AAC.1